MTSPNKKFYTAQEFAEMLGYNVMTVYRYIKAGKLAVYKFGKEFRISIAEAQKFIEKSKI